MGNLTLAHKPGRIEPWKLSLVFYPSKLSSVHENTLLIISFKVLAK